MKTAVCISGLPREINEIWRTFIDNFLNNLPSPDVFIYSGEQFKVDPEYFVQIKPKKYVVEPQFRHETLEEIIKKVGYFCEDHINSYIQQTYGLKKVWELKESYEKEHNVKYDIVVRTRPDFIYLNPITLDLLELDKFNNLQGNTPLNITTEFAIGPMDYMEPFFNVYDWLIETNGSLLTKDNPHLNGAPGGLYNPDIIASVYVLNERKVPRATCKLPPGKIVYDYYRIMYRHKLNLY